MLRPDRYDTANRLVAHVRSGSDRSGVSVAIAVEPLSRSARTALIRSLGSVLFRSCPNRRMPANKYAAKCRLQHILLE